MKKLLTFLRKDSGFTLIELMVVVSIIGLLSAVAIPNFRKYQAKSKISEARLQLSAAYTAEAAFFSDFNMYAQCLPYMGFDPGPESASRYYAIGFNAGVTINTTAYNAAVNSGLSSATAGCPNPSSATGATGARSANNAMFFAAGKGLGAMIANNTDWVAGSALGSQEGIDTMTFTISAGAPISQEFTSAVTSSLLDINHNKVLRNVRNGY